MKSVTNQKHYDVIVVGGGSAGIAAAIASARHGARTLLIESGPYIGGEMLSGIPIDGCLSSRGEWIVGGISRELFNECEKYDGYVGAITDYRALWIVCIDPEVMKFVIPQTVRKAGVELLLYSFVDGVLTEDNTVRGVFVTKKSGRTLYTADVVIDCTGDGDVGYSAGAEIELGGSKGELQPVTMVYRVSNVDTKRLLNHVKEHPEDVSLSESEMFGMNKDEAAEALWKQGLPKVFLTAEGPLLGGAINDGVMYPCSMLAITPNSLPRKEVGINSTRVSGVNALNTEELSAALSTLLDQAFQGVRFLKERVPGFEDSAFAGFAPRIGIRETRRIIGDYILTDEDVLEARKKKDGIAKGGHEYDVHGAGTDHDRRQIKDGGSYDIPYGCLLPKGISNLLVAGRQLSSTRGAHSSARVMGTCMAMGQAAGTAAAIASRDGISPRDIDVQNLREILMKDGAVLEGTY